MSKEPNNSNFIKDMFAEVPETYERINHILTMGFDTIWRKRIAKMAANIDGAKVADLCSGTGETAAYLCEYMPDAKITAVDFSPEMLAEAKKKPAADRIEFVISDIKELPFPDNHFDIVTMSFATRNININKEILTRSFTEYHRVLKPRGHFINLETSQPRNAFIRKLDHLYINLFIKRIGQKISGSKTGYAYLADTIPRFYSAEELAQIMKDAGFITVDFKRLLFGAAAIHHAVKN